MPSKKKNTKNKKAGIITLPEEVKPLIWAGVMFLAGIIAALSFFDLSGSAGAALKQVSLFLIGNAFFGVPLIFILTGTVLLKDSWGFKKVRGLAIFITFVLIMGVSGTLSTIELSRKTELLDNFVWN